MYEAKLVNLGRKITLGVRKKNFEYGKKIIIIHLYLSFIHCVIILDKNEKDVVHLSYRNVYSNLSYKVIFRTFLYSRSQFFFWGYHRIVSSAHCWINKVRNDYSDIFQMIFKQLGSDFREKTPFFDTNNTVSIH